MAINLQKGQRVNLTKKGETLSKIIVGLGWDPVSKTGGKGLLSGLLGRTPTNKSRIDCDASVIMLDENDKAKSQDIIYYGNLRSSSGGVVHAGDNLTGVGDGDDEVITIELPKLWKKTKKLVFVVNIFNCKERNQDFGMIKNAYIRVVNASNNQELIRYSLTEDYSGKTALIVGEIYRHDDEWKFVAVGEGTNDVSLKELTNRYR